MRALEIPTGHHPLKLTAVTAANFGDAGGSATVDRPVALDSWDRLPHLAASALKGVLAGRFGNAGLAGDPLTPSRAILFGSPDTVTGSGRPGSLVFGDGELLSFPVALRTGERATVLVARTLYRLARQGLLRLPGLRRVERADCYQGAVPPGALPAVAHRHYFGLAPADLSALSGEKDAGHVVVAAPEAAERLWGAAVEERTQTALGVGKVVVPGSLRTVELIPAGTVFVSLVSNLAAATAELGPARLLQVGAWEATGFGFLAPELWQATAVVAEPAVQPSAAGADARPEHEVMVRAYEAMRSSSLEHPREASVARSALLDLGPRLRIRGLPGTLAFCLAKASGEERQGRPNLERRAYRWLLRELLRLPPAAPFAAIHERAVAVISGSDPAPAELETTWLWLRRYSETMIQEAEP